MVSKSVDSKLDYFFNYTMGHAVLLDAYEKIWHRLEIPSIEQIIFVVGPTGCGKTTMSTKLLDKLIKKYMKMTKKNRDILPVALTEVPRYTKNNFRWSDLYIEWLLALHNPMAAGKVKLDPVDPDSKAKITETNLRRAVVKTLNYRETKFMLFDEGNHFAKVAGQNSYIDQIENIESLASMGKVCIIIFGTYELLDLWNLSGKLARKSAVIHLRRYLYDRDDDYENFSQIVRTFERVLPLKVKPELEKHLEFIWIRCAGIIGVLKAWLYKCLEVVLKDDFKTITYDILRKYAPRAKKLQEILRNVPMYEQNIKAEESEDYSSIASTVGIVLDSKGKLIAEHQEAHVLDSNGNPISKQEEAKPEARKKRSRILPGNRKPGRDTVGRIEMTKKAA